MNRIIHFIKYHNAFTIGLFLVFVFSGAIFASEDVRNAVIGEKIVTEQGIDNSQLLATDLDNFDLQIQIINVSEDENKYYVTYQYRTLVVKDNVWQIVIEQPTLTVYKDSLGNSDLGLYVAKKLSEVADYALNFLKEVQTAEKEKGLTKLVASVNYTGLIGLVLDVKEKVLPGYEPIVQAPEPEPQITGESTSSQPSEPAQPLTLQVITEEQLSQNSVDPEFIRQLVQEILNQQQTPAAEQPPAEQPPTEQQAASTATSTAESTSTDMGQPPANSSSTEATTTQATSTESENIATSIEATTTEATSTQLTCTPDWQCSDWQPLPETIACGETFTQTRTCNDGCGNEKTEEQETSGSLCSAQNANGTCQESTCSFTCQEGYQNCDNDWTNGCETQGECQP